ncbi:MAG: corrinoid protein [Dictyoglomus sp.]|nr:corrinoid protein [Dictyoglomus sp.]MCX7942235.1 corrinoid protein [Dictyoglomaceae bacterium]MDW8188206.1 corrinoid protein [Dictyoglomus sp.]
MVELSEIASALIEGNRKKVQELVELAIKEGIPPERILNEGLLAGMQVIGERFKNNEIFVPEVLISARAMHAGMNLLKPLLAKSQGILKGKVVIGTVKGDLHDIGKNLVAMMLEGAGYQVIDLGIDVDAEKFVEAVKTHNPDILGMSALLTTTMPYMRTTIEALEKEGVRDKVKVIVGGAPVTEEFAKEIGADGYADSASSAVELVDNLLGIKSA